MGCSSSTCEEKQEQQKLVAIILSKPRQPATKLLTLISYIGLKQDDNISKESQDHYHHFEIADPKQRQNEWPNQENIVSRTKLRNVSAFATV
jgi:hypothetical protein